MLLDAAMGTRLIALGLDLAADDPCLWNQSHPEAVLPIHRLDLEAGAEAVFTNTFGANRSWLARFDRQDLASRINRQAVALARSASSPDRFVVGSIGPTAAIDEFSIREQAETLVEAGVDALALETFRFDQAVAALRFLGPREVPVLVGLYSWSDPIVATSRRLIDAGASIVGANCFADLDLALRLVDDLAAGGAGLFWLKPSPGPLGADFAHIASRLASVGTGMLGGCCGTSDAHLRAIRAVWSERGRTDPRS